MSNPNTWPSKDDDRLRALWGGGLSTAKIAVALGKSKNAVVGRAHRLNLPSRPSPIKARLDGAPIIRTPTPPRMRKSVSPVIHGPRVLTGTMKPQPCCWPIGEPGKRSFHFCNAASVPGKPYCDLHCAIAYVRAEKAA